LFQRPPLLFFDSPALPFLTDVSEDTPTRKDFDPDDYRMTVGEHLEDLRRRLILALVGFVIAAVFCLYFGRTVIFPVFTRPLTQTQMKFGLPPQLHSDEVADIFGAYLNISLISAAVIASPWILWQFWLFVAAGLYSHERKIVTKYIPLSIALLISGMLFVYYFVLPWTLEFFIAFSIGVPLNLSDDATPTPAPSPPAMTTTGPATKPAAATRPTFRIPTVDGRLPHAQEGDMWFDRLNGRIEAMLGGQVRVIRFSAENLIATDYKLPAYIDLVVGMLVTFGLSFQMPLVVLALVRSNLVPRETLKAARQYVYFGIAVLAAVITPGDYITGTVLLIGPLVMLYELGLWLAREPRGSATT
jgi:sec-independent protein translocase protein TatC